MKEIVDFVKGFDLHTIILVTVAFFFLNSNFNSSFNILDRKIEKLSDKIEDVDKRLCRIEGSSMCYAKNSRNSETVSEKSIKLKHVE